MPERRVCHLSSVHRTFDTRVFHKECRSLAAAGYAVTLVIRHERDETVAGVRIAALPAPRGRLARMTGTVAALWRRAVALDADLYHFHDPELIPVGLLLRLRGKRVVYDAHEDYARQLRGKPWLPRPLRVPVAVVAGGLELLAAPWLSAVVAAGRDIEERFAGRARRVVRVENFPVLEPRLVEAPPRPDPAPGRLRLVNFGGVWSARVTGEIVAALERLPGELDVRLVLGGRVFEQELLERLQQSPGWRRVDYRGVVDREELIDASLAADAGLVLYADHPNHHAIRSNRLYETMLAGLPVVVSDFPVWRRFIEEHRCGLAVDPHDPDAIAEALAWLASHPGEAREMGRRGRAAVLERYNWEREAEKLLDLYRELLGDSAPEGAS